MPRPRPRKQTGGEQPLTRELLQAVADSLANCNVNALAVSAGIDQASLRRFLSRERSLSLDSADRLCVVLGLKLVRGSKKKTSPKAVQAEGEVLEA